MELRSDSFKDGARVPDAQAFCVADEVTHVTFGPNRNPHLLWTDPPDSTKSFALICHDRDVPTQPDDVNQEGREVPADLARTDFFHWVLIDLPPDLREIGEGTFAAGVVERGRDTSESPHGSRQGSNDYTSWFAGDEDMAGIYSGYDGPCPPWNDTLIHHYTFTLWALDADGLDLAEIFTGQDVRNSIEGHVLATASITGSYSLNPGLA
ncbi:MAG: YbhB/YbcL family Raf kinase inhibitor-like protein [Acidimicrobiia bacterium]|nr:MAG: YbhB/YbcL family Raf kinase inhibitor-like protein [Acidimicrobiia bacterium]